MLFHLAIFIGLLYVGFSLPAFLFCLVFGYIGIITVFVTYHRLLSHRAFKTSRTFQFILTFLSSGFLNGVSPLIWVSVHRHHHKFTDTDLDYHSPKHGVLNAHMRWMFTFNPDEHDTANIKDLLKYPEILWLSGSKIGKRRNMLPAFLNLMFVLALGYVVGNAFPHWGLTLGQAFMWGYIFRSLVTHHGIWASASLCHMFGGRPYDNGDTSTNSFLLALITAGEGWHNNHHRYQSSARAGFTWQQIDVNFYVIKLLEKLHLVWDVRDVPKKVLDEGYGRQSNLSNAPLKS
jgi:stearoyl-CoA desaturase (delta-9 desaturase)